MAKFIFKLFLIILFPLLGFYLFQIGTAIQTSYLIKDKQVKVDKMKEQILSLQVKAAKDLSLSELENKITELGFVEVDKVKFLSFIDKPLAKIQEITYNKQ